jgi:hypothetical protein
MGALYDALKVSATLVLLIVSNALTRDSETRTYASTSSHSSSSGSHMLPLYGLISRAAASVALINFPSDLRTVLWELMLLSRLAPCDVGAGRGDGDLESKVEVSESVEPVFALSASSFEPCSVCFEAASDDTGLI